MPRSRKPSHAGSWYESSPDKLEAQIDGWLAQAHAEPQAGVRAIIAP
jgi:AmmeMemoRadiSam system protein B